MRTYSLKKGPADPFRGDWYELEVQFNSVEEAIGQAMARTLENYKSLGMSWVEFGWEWSVFEVNANGEHKIWEGYKFIQVFESQSVESLNPEWGNM